MRIKIPPEKMEQFKLLLKNDHDKLMKFNKHLPAIIKGIISGKSIEEISKDLSIKQRTVNYILTKSRTKIDIPLIKPKMKSIDPVTDNDRHELYKRLLKYAKKEIHIDVLNRLVSGKTTTMIADETGLKRKTINNIITMLANKRKIILRRKRKNNSDYEENNFKEKIKKPKEEKIVFQKIDDNDTNSQSNKKHVVIITNDIGLIKKLIQENLE